MRILSLVLVCFFIFNKTEASVKLPQSDRLLAERFANPPAESRILKIIHNWPDDSKAQDNLISKLSDAGFGGVVCNVSFDKYLESEKKWVAFVRAVKAANKMGMSLWLYDEKGYPSGTAGGLTMRDHPEWEARGLLIADKECEGGVVNLDLPPGKLIMAIAYPAERGKYQSIGGLIYQPIFTRERLAGIHPQVIGTYLQSRRITYMNLRMLKSALQISSTI